ncbi:hypothetical protein SAMN02745134_00822 [Clostridium acidisoli DSM 12555]|uniref:DUF5659 domain-containing protein n=1 Tax=Clostridium acidisoli DSM 12555 TaxID=1121291 RepID=A0A1W1X6Q9_9CLOT|nr:hypothetical protein [Clostridium acidisoli]SMC19408.1 hypothetical protein SAMN02745134_00822 [Clostridium acidisoli DSM 12555]
MENEYYEIKKKYLAFALSFLGFRYFVFNDADGDKYSFENTEKFQLALDGLLKLRITINK